MKKPTFFGKYLLLERINVGGMAEVFIAKAFGVEGFERILAIKKILPTMAEDEEFITMFIDEARISVQLNHANVVHIHELGKHDDTYFIAMEYVAGRDVRTILERYRRRKEIMPTAQAVFIVSKMCEGLDYAHRKKDARGQDLHIIHRDVSPQNILVSYEGEVKIIDFGIAKAANRSQKTQAGILKGKFGYMSPEQVRGMPIDRRSDIFAVGVLLYEMLTGEKLFVGESDFSTLEKVRNADVPTPREFNPNISAGLEKVVMKALAREPEERYQWASDLQEDLMRFLLAGDAIYSSKHLSGYMKEAFAEDLLREAEKMERYASVERPDQIETSGVTVPPPSPRPSRASRAVSGPTGPAAGRSPTAPAAPAPGYVPPPTADELAEMDGAADKTQIVDSTNAAFLSPETRVAESSVVVDDSATGRTENPMAKAGSTSSAYPSPYSGQESARAPKSKSGPKAQVVIGDEEGEGYAGATMIGPAPSAPPARGRPAAPEPEESTGNMVVPSNLRSNGARGRARQEEPPEDEVGDGYDAPPEDDGYGQQEPDDYGDEDRGAADPDEETAGARAPGGARKPAKPAKSPPAKPAKASAPAKAKASSGKGIPKVAIIGAAALVALLLVAGLAVVMRKPSTGSATFVVTPSAGATVKVDGRPVKINDVVALKPGRHQITAIAPGYQPLAQQIDVVAGQEAAVVSLQLVPSQSPANTPPPPTETKPTPVAAQEPTGVKPATEVKPTATPEPGEKPAPEVKPTAVATPEPTPPPKPAAPATFTALFDGDAGAEIAVDGKPAGKAPSARMPGLAVGKSYKFTARLAGYKPYSGRFESDGSDVLKVTFALEKEPEREPPPPRTPKPAPPPPVAAVKTPPKAAVMGKFACSTKPAGAQIWVDGKNTGRETPVALGNPLMLPVGKRKIVFKLNGKSTKPQVVPISEDGVAKLVNVPIE
ncbi:protein kinase [Corallococcus sp. H22C18031201]|nr:protein kinase [Corallococcus sp. H22C18031201]